jgi:hypothetical protein
MPSHFKRSLLQFHKPPCLFFLFVTQGVCRVELPLVLVLLGHVTQMQEIFAAVEHRNCCGWLFVALGQQTQYVIFTM